MPEKLKGENKQNQFRTKIIIWNIYFISVEEINKMEMKITNGHE